MQGIFLMIYVSFFWDYLAMDQTLFIVAMVIYGIFNALNDPLLGQWSDRVDVKKWGSRRLIFIKYGGPIWALLFFLMWIPWSLNNQIIIFFHFMIMVVLFDNMLTICVIVWDALLPEIAENIEDRNKIFFLGGIVGTIGGIPVFVALAIFNDSLLLFQIFICIIAIFNSIVFIIAGSKLQEREELHQKINEYKLIESLGHCFRSKSFVYFTIYRFFHELNNILLFSFLFVYAVLFIPGLETILIVFIGVGFIIGQWFYIRLSKNRPIQNLIIKGKIIEIILGTIAFLISLLPGTEIIWFSLFMVKIGLGGYLVFMNPYLLLVTDEDELEFNTRREGMFLGTNAIFNKIAETIGPILGTTILLIFGYIQNAPEGFTQPENAIVGIKFLLFIVPSILGVFGILALNRYPIKGEYLEKLKNSVEKIHKEKLIAYEKDKLAS